MWNSVSTAFTVVALVLAPAGLATPPRTIDTQGEEGSEGDFG